MRGALCYCCCQTPTTAAISSLSLFPKRNTSPGSLPSRSISVYTAEPQVASGNQVLRRRLILLRHAESAAPGRFLRDHDRPLSKSGRTDAIEVTRKLREMGWIPELILSRCYFQSFKGNLQWASGVVPKNRLAQLLLNVVMY